jgi:hypothetical protein
MAAKEEGKQTEDVVYEKASQSDYVKNVAKDTVGGFTSSAEGKLVIYIIPIVVVVIVLALLLSRCGG